MSILGVKSKCTEKLFLVAYSTSTDKSANEEKNSKFPTFYSY